MITPINNRTVSKLIDRYGYWFYVVKLVPSTECTCVNHTTRSADPKCRHCLGTGHKIKIIKVFGSIREKNERETEANTDVNSTHKIVYIKGMHRINKDDLVIDNEDVFRVLACQYHKGEKGEFAFTRLVCPYVKGNVSHIIRNFKELLHEHKLRKKK